MITLDQIKQLDIKVRKAIDKIISLSSENKLLQTKLDDYQLRIEELEILIDSFKEDQGEIENGIIEALNQLETMDDDIKTPGSESEEQENNQDDQIDTKETSDNEPDTGAEENNDTSVTEDEEISETDNEKSSEPVESKDNSDIELDIF